MEPITVVKVGGNELDAPEFLEGLCTMLAAFAGPLVLIHGGGKEITGALERYDQPSRFIEGLRVTPPESMAVMEMVVCGSVNKRIVAKLITAGQPALGLSGVDLGLVRCAPHRPKGADLGRVGEVTRVDTVALRTLIAQGWLPVIAPVALGEEDGLAYNINADHMALGVAAGLTRAGDAPSEVVFVSNVPGVMLDGQVIARLTATEIEQGIASGAISGGMIPKVRSALAALKSGASGARITNLEGFAEGGTRITM